MATKDKDNQIDKGKKDKLELAKKLAEKMLRLLDIKAEVEVARDEENEAISVQIKTEEPGIVIGWHGETLASIQLLLAAMVSRQAGEWMRVLVNVDNWRQKREEALKRMASLAAQKAHFSGESVVLPPMPASERRIIHLHLTEDKEVVTESQGEGKFRRVVVKLAK